MKDINEIKEEILKKYNNRFILLDERFITTETNKRREFLFEDTKLHTTFWTQLYRLNKYGHETIRYNTENISRKIKELTNGEYELVGECNNCHQKIEILHKKCGKTRFYDASHFINDGSRCHDCSVKSITKTDEKFDLELKQIGNERFKRNSEYIGYHKAIAIKCCDCNNTFITKPVNIDRQFKTLGELRCPLCDNEYYGEKKTSEFLIEKGIKFIPQYWNKECKDKKPLKFDFAIFDKDYKCSISDIKDLPKAVIEFDGPQHSDPKSKYAIGERFNEIQLHDNMKNQFCKLKNIPILRITSYNKAVIKNQIQEFLKSLNIL